LCQVLQAISLYFAKIADDPPDRRYRVIALPRSIAPRRAPGVSCGRQRGAACRRLDTASLAYEQALKGLAVVAGAMSGSVDRFSGAANGGKADQALAQAAAARAYAGMVLSAIDRLRGPSLALAGELRAAGQARVGRAEIKRRASRARQGVQSPDIRALLGAFARRPPRSLDKARLLSAQIPTADLRVTWQSILPAEVAALVRTLASGGQLGSASTQLGSDANALLTARDATARDAAARALLGDASNAGIGNVGTLIAFAARGLIAG
jgi:hypothetical protein